MKSKKILLKTFSIVSWTVVSILFVLSVFSLIDRFTGYNFSLFGIRASYIASESMETVHKDNVDYLIERDDRYFKNDLIFVKVAKTPQEIKELDVVLFYSFEHECLVVHRVLEIYSAEDPAKYYFKTRGDANNVSDLLINFVQIKGVVTKRIPHIGDLFGYINSAYGLFGFFTVGTIFFGGWYLNTVVEDRHEKRTMNKKHKKV